MKNQTYAVRYQKHKKIKVWRLGAGWLTGLAGLASCWLAGWLGQLSLAGMAPSLQTLIFVVLLVPYSILLVLYWHILVFWVRYISFLDNEIAALYNKNKLKRVRNNKNLRTNLKANLHAPWAAKAAS